MVDEADVEADGEDVGDVAERVLRRVEHGSVVVLGGNVHLVYLQNTTIIGDRT